MHRLMIMCLTLGAAAPAFAQSGAQSGKARITEEKMLDHIGAADSNGDGVVTRDEFKAMRAEQFDKLDANGDGYLTQNERPKLAQKSGAINSSKLFKALDKNGDGKIDRDEFVNGPAPLFGRLDTNGNDVVSKEEIEAARAKLRAGQ